MKKFLMVALMSAAMAGGATSVYAQNGMPVPVEAAAGVKVLDTAGGEVGVVEKVEGDIVTVNTGKNKAALPKTSFAATSQGLVLAMTKDQLDAAAEQAAAAASQQLAAQIQVGADVRAADGTTVLGKISEVGETDFVLTGEKGAVRLAKTAIAAGPNGLMVGLTAQQMQDAIAQAAQAAPAAAETAAAPEGAETPTK